MSGTPRGVRFRDRAARLKRALASEKRVRNLYLLPAVIGSPIARQDMCNGSNWGESEYLSQVSPEFLPQLSEDERSWIGQQLESALFRRVKDEYVSAHHALLTEKSVEKRSAILRRWDKFWADATANDG